MKSVLITGCNRGIGLALVKEFLKVKTPPQTIIATCRDIQKADELRIIAGKNPNVHILTIDLNNYKDYGEFSRNVQGLTKDSGLNLLVNNAGITTKFTRVQLVKVEQMIDNLLINTVAPLMLTKELLPLLKLSAEKSKSETGAARAAIINISSILGSISQNTEGGFYPYRCSKAALNAITKSLSVDLKKDKILVTCIHPGWCKTDMGGKNAPMEVETAAKLICETISKLSDKDSGTFIQYDGKPIQW